MKASDDEENASCDDASNQASVEVSDLETVIDEEPTQSSDEVKPKIKVQCDSGPCTQSTSETKPTDSDLEVDRPGTSTPRNVPATSEASSKIYLSYSGSSSENDDECCIYMLKGYSGMDTPPIGRLRINEREARQTSSPEMDFLEMDFDPGQSNGHEDCSEDCDVCNKENPDYRPNVDDVPNNDRECESTSMTQHDEGSDVPSLSKLAEVASSSINVTDDLLTTSNDNWHNVPPLRISALRELGDAELPPSVTPAYQAQEVEMDQLASAMIWSEAEAEERQVISSNSPENGVAAVTNAVASFNMGIDIEAVSTLLDTSKPLDGLMLVHYIFTRSINCSSHEDIINAINHVSKGKLISRFFATFPRRQLALCAWLLFWINKGAVPILTMRQQRRAPSEHNTSGAGDWQHRMVSGVTPRDITFTDPVSVVPEAVVLDKLSRPSTILISRTEIVSRWRPDIDLNELVNHPDQTWKSLNVLGQIVNIIRDEMRGCRANDVNNITIPTKLTCGITLIMTIDNPHVRDLCQASELPIAQIF